MEIIEDSDQLTLKAKIGVGTRVVVFGLGLIPFLAPYQLLYKPHWKDFTPFLFMPIAISLVAALLGFFLMYAAFKSPSSEYTFDRRRRQLQIKSLIPFGKLNSSVYIFSEIQSITPQVTEWEDSNSYYLALEIKDQSKPLKIGPFADQQQSSRAHVALKKLLASD